MTTSTSSPAASDGSSPSLSVSQLTVPQKSLYDSIVDFGFTSREVLYAILVTKHTNIQSAIDFIITAKQSPTSSLSLFLAAPPKGENSTNPSNSTNPNKRNKPTNSDRPLSEEEQLQMAMQQSLSEAANPSAPPVSAALGVSTDDAQMSQAILMSLGENTKGNIENTGWVDPSNPHKRRRDNMSIPVGLKNVGNICYFNSLVQTFFFLRPALFESLMEITKPPEDQWASLTDSEKSSIDFVLSLQSLFSHLHFSERKYFDPQSSVNALFKTLEKSEGPKRNQKEQQDATEFSEFLIETFDCAMKRVNGGKFSCLVRSLFYGDCAVEVSALNEQKTQTLSMSKESFQNVILDISTGNLMGAFDQWASAPIESFRIPQSNFISPSARKTLHVQRFPSVLNFQLQRVQYDTKAKAPVKRNEKFEFQKEIFVDRFLEKNADETRKRREIQRNFEEKRADLQKELTSMEEYGNSKIPIDEALRLSADFLSKISEGAMADENSVDLSAILRKHSENSAKKMAALREEISNLTGKIEHLYDDLRDHKYSLFSVLIHDGRNAGEGHYWSYVFDFAHSQWFVFNDAHVAETSEATVWEEATGGRPNKSGSAYCLIYIQSEHVKGLTKQYAEEIIPNAIIPKALRAAAEKDNEEFHKEITEFDKKQFDKDVNTESDKIISLFTSVCSDWKEMQKAVSEKKMSNDDDVRLKSFPWFIHRFGRPSFGPDGIPLDELTLLSDILSNFKIPKKDDGKDDALKREKIIESVAAKLQKNKNSIGFLLKTLPHSQNAPMGFSRFIISPPSSPSLQCFEVPSALFDEIARGATIFQRETKIAEFVSTAMGLFYGGKESNALYFLLFALFRISPFLSASANLAHFGRADFLTVLCKIAIWGNLLKTFGTLRGITATQTSSDAEISSALRLLDLSVKSSRLFGHPFVAFVKRRFIALNESLQNNEGGESALQQQMESRVIAVIELSAAEQKEKDAVATEVLAEFSEFLKAPSPNEIAPLEGFPFFSPSLSAISPNLSAMLSALPTLPVPSEVQSNADPLTLYSRWTQVDSRVKSSFKDTMKILPKDSNGNAMEDTEDDDEREIQNSIQEIKKIIPKI